jgi:hypothetical protein
MPYLFCDEHGREEQATCEAEQDDYRLLKEAVLMVTGPLRTGPFHCDRCNALLKKGQPAWLMVTFTSYFAQELGVYDYQYERNYFSLDRVEATVYGAEPSGGVPSPQKKHR